MSWPEIKHKLAAAPTFGCRLTANLWVQSAVGNFMVPTGQLLPDSAIENKGCSYVPRPTYGSNRGKVMGIVTDDETRSISSHMPF